LFICHSLAVEGAERWRAVADMNALHGMVFPLAPAEVVDFGLVDSFLAEADLCCS